ncbi:hypothetical protein SEUCBS139899_010521 [Sporothrix eucalyptigena]
MACTTAMETAQNDTRPEGSLVKFLTLPLTAQHHGSSAASSIAMSGTDSGYAESRAHVSHMASRS